MLFCVVRQWTFHAPAEGPDPVHPAWVKARAFAGQPSAGSEAEGSSSNKVPTKKDCNHSGPQSLLNSL